MLEIHGASASPFVRKVRVALAEKGIPYRQIPVVPFGLSEEFKRISPLGKIPVLQDGDYTLPDSSCIIAYLERVQPEPPLYPRDPRQYGRALFLEEYADTRLVETLAPVFFERFVKVRLLGQKADEARCREQIDQKAPPVLDWLEAQAPTGDGMVGGRFGIADIALASPFVNFSHVGERVDARRWPKLAAHVERVWSRPSFKGLIEGERKEYGL
jgi:glutathione S-transferase